MTLQFLDGRTMCLSGGFVSTSIILHVAMVFHALSQTAVRPQQSEDEIKYTQQVKRSKQQVAAWRLVCRT